MIMVGNYLSVKARRIQETIYNQIKLVLPETLIEKIIELYEELNDEEDGEQE